MKQDIKTKNEEFSSFTISEELKELIWEKGLVDEKYDSKHVRKDACGAWMVYEYFGDTNSPFGWVIDHIVPSSYLKNKGANENEINNIINLRPLNWANDKSKGDDFPNYSSVVKAVDDHNEPILNDMTIENETMNKLRKLYKKYDI